MPTSLIVLTVMHAERNKKGIIEVAGVLKLPRFTVLQSNTPNSNTTVVLQSAQKSVSTLIPEIGNEMWMALFDFSTEGRKI